MSLSESTLAIGKAALSGLPHGRRHALQVQLQESGNVFQFSRELAVAAKQNRVSQVDAATTDIMGHIVMASHLAGQKGPQGSAVVFLWDELPPMPATTREGLNAYSAALRHQIVESWKDPSTQERQQVVANVLRQLGLPLIISPRSDVEDIDGQADIVSRHFRNVQVRYMAGHPSTRPCELTAVAVIATGGNATIGK